MTIRVRPTETNFDRISNNMDKTADQLKDAAKDQMKEAGKAVRRSGDHAAAAGAHLAGAAANALFATGKTLEGVGETAMAAGHVAAAAGLGTVGAAGWVGESAMVGGRFVAKNTAKGFAAIANGLTRIIGDGRYTTVRELAGDPNATRFSERMFGEAAKQLNKSADAMNAAWNAYGEAVGHMAGAGVNVVFAAGHTLGVAKNLAEAAGRTGVAGSLKVAEFGVRAGSVAVQAAEQGVVGARELAILSAKFSAGVANILAQPDQGQIKVQTRQLLKQYETELNQLIQKESSGVGQVDAAIQLRTEVRQAIKQAA